MGHPKLRIKLNLNAIDGGGVTLKSDEKSSDLGKIMLPGYAHVLFYKTR